MSLLAVILGTTGCENRSSAAQHKTTVRVAGPTASYGEYLARTYGQLLPDVTFQIVSRVGPIASDDILTGQVDIGLALADSPYQKNLEVRSQQNYNREYRAIGVIGVAPLNLLVRSGSGITSLSGLRGRRVGTMRTDTITDWVLKALDFHDIVNVPVLRPEVSRQALKATFDANALDAMFIANMYPAPIVEEAINAGMFLLPIEAEQVTRLPLVYPILRLLSLPANTYPRQPERIRTIGMPFLLVCRSDLDDDITYRLAEHLLDAMSRIPMYHAALRHVSVQDISATPIPLHEGAARYYREYEVLQ
jgi:TRAP transporter TAXI family solute receptor